VHDHALLTNYDMNSFHPQIFVGLTFLHQL
jgi:hypothetical protein